MLTVIKDVGLPSAKYKGRFVADGRRVPRAKQFAPPISLGMKRTTDLNGLIDDGTGSEHGVITADMTNGYLNANLDSSIEIYMRVPKEFQTEEMKKWKIRMFGSARPCTAYHRPDLILHGTQSLNSLKILATQKLLDSLLCISKRLKTNLSSSEFTLMIST